MNIIIGIIIVAIVVFLCTGYVKAPPDKAVIISGIGKHPRVLIGKAGFKIPFLERVDRMGIGQIDIDIETEDYIPTKDFINIKVDAIAQVAINTDSNSMEIAMRNFLNKKPDEVRNTITKSLQGNLREIIGTMELKDICQNKAEFSEQVKSNAEGDIAQLGIRILSFNVQNIQDKDGLIDDLGIDNREQIRKSASIAKANAEKEVAIEKAKANNEANIERVKADTAIAERENQLAIKKASLKLTEDTAKAKADAAYKIQEESSRKEIEIQTQEADIAKREKEIELQSKEAEVAEKKLDAEVRKKAEAEKYAEMQKADAELYKRQKEAEAKLYEQEKEAAAIEAKGQAEARAIQLKGEADATAMDRKAEAMKKYGDAAITEMIVKILPDMAKAIAEPISAIDKVTVIGGDSNGVSDMAENVPAVLAKVMESMKETTGVDLKSIIEANSKEAKTDRNITIHGLEKSKSITDEVIETPSAQE